MCNDHYNTKSILLVCLFLLLTGGICEMVPTSDPIDLKEIPGVYEANYDAGQIDKVELKGDSVYIRYFVSKDGHKFIDSGKCWYYYRGNDSTGVAITMLNFVNRFTVSPDDKDVYSTATNAVYDSLPHDFGTVFFKDDDQIRINRQTFGQAYIKRLK